MSDQSRAALSRDVLTRGRMLAEQRLAYLVELHESGRWKRFHHERDFLSDIHATRSAVDAWRRLEEV